MIGEAGTGKSTIASQFAKRFEGRGPLGASFFFTRGVQYLNSPRKFFSTVASQLARSQSALRIPVINAAREHLKTATLQQLEPVNGEVSVIVLCHTRELAFQIKNEYTRFAKYMPDVRVSTFFGGTPVVKDADLLRDKTKCPHIVVATPGRLNALVRDKVLDASKVKHFILDECDKMLEQLG